MTGQGIQTWIIYVPLFALFPTPTLGSAKLWNSQRIVKRRVAKFYGRILDTLPGETSREREKFFPRAREIFPATERNISREPEILFPATMGFFRGLGISGMILN